VTKIDARYRNGAVTDKRAIISSIFPEKMLVVHRHKGKSISMMSLAEYNALQETLHLNRSKTNRQRLENAIENINSKTNLSKKPIVE
jgi:antitoxin YefM